MTESREVSRQVYVKGVLSLWGSRALLCTLARTYTIVELP